MTISKIFNYLKKKSKKMTQNMIIIIRISKNLLYFQPMYKILNNYNNSK